MDKRDADWKDQLGELVFSTGNPELSPISDEPEFPDAQKHEQILRIWLDKKSRNGKAVSLIRGFTCRDQEIRDLASALKSHCGVGGSFKNGEILIQGDHRKKILEYLLKAGYKNSKLAGG